MGEKRWVPKTPGLNTVDALDTADAAVQAVPGLKSSAVDGRVTIVGGHTTSKARARLGFARLFGASGPVACLDLPDAETLYYAYTGVLLLAVSRLAHSETKRCLANFPFCSDFFGAVPPSRNPHIQR